MSSENNGALLYRPLTQPRSAGFWGLTRGTTMIGIVLVGVILLSFLLPMPLPLVVTGACAVVFVPLVWQRGGRSGWELATMSWQYRKARRRGETFYRGGTFSAIPGSSKLPGLLAASRLSEDVSIGGQRFAMIHLQRRNHYTVVLRVAPRGQEWIDQAQFDRRAEMWGDAVARIGSAADIVAIAAVVETIPETGQRLEASVEELIDASADELSAAIMREAAQLDEGAIRTEARVSVTFRAETALRRRSPEEQANEIARRLPGIVGALERAELRARPMTAGEVCAVVRRAFSPEALRNLEKIGLDKELDTLRWSAAGPVSHSERRDHYLHDGGQSITWEMDASPPSVVQADILKPLLAPHPDLPWKRVALVYRPHSSAEAVKMVDQDYTNALVAEQSAAGQVSAAATLRVGLAKAAREEQAQGAGVTRLGALITVTTPVGADMPAVESLTKDMAATSRLGIRRCYGYQAAAFAGALGIGVVLPEHASVSDSLAG